LWSNWVSKETGSDLHRVERAYGNFARTFTLPDYVDDTKVRADFKDGVLTLHLPKSEKAKPKVIEGKVG
jgi:HSP20 family protein